MTSSSKPSSLLILLGLGLAGICLIANRFKKAIRKDFGAFIDKKLQLLPPPQPPPPKARHPLTDLSFAVSDVFDIEGYVTGFGHPDWEKTHEPASRTSLVVSTLVEGGATCIGKTVVDELAYSVHGENKHYDTPTNPAETARLPGGSCSGAAVAVAANLVDFSLGVDAVGGVRVPAAFCGVIGFRPSHGVIPHTGTIPVSESLDTVGWFAKDPSVLHRVSHVLLQLPFGVQRNPRQIIIADDCLQLLKIPVDRVAQVVIKSTEKICGKQVLKRENLSDYLDSKVPTLKVFLGQKSNPETKISSITILAQVMQLIQRWQSSSFLYICSLANHSQLNKFSQWHEFRQNHAEWIKTSKAILDPALASVIYGTQDASESDIDNFKTVQAEMRAAVNSLLKDDGILVIPTIAYAPPKIGGKEIFSEDYQNRTFGLLSIASLSGCCQVTIPIGFHNKCPVSVSFIARHGGDRFLLDTVKTMYASMQEHVDTVAESKLQNNSISQEQTAEIAKEKGNQAYKEEQWQKAVGFYTEAIKLNGNNPTYYKQVSYSFSQAEADCTKAINLDKKNVKAYLRRGTAREMLGFYAEAIEDFKYALVLEPTNKRAASSADRLRKLFQF
ncbi:hypothetical protein ACFE04_010145 [Oxalis oulophora]